MKNIVLLISLLFTSLITTQAHSQQSIFDSSSIFSNESEYLKVDQAFIFNFYQKDNKLTVSFDIAEGYYLYQQQFKFTANNATIIQPSFPEGLIHEDEFFGVQTIYKHQVVLPINFEEINDAASITITYQGCAEKGLCYPPEKQIINLTPFKETSDISTVITNAVTPSQGSSSALEKNTNSVSEQNQLAQMLSADNIWLTLAAFFVGGLLLSFTPCVFPMYPILTGIIVGQGDKLSNKKAFSLSFAYVQGMAVTYTILGIVVALAGAQFQAWFQHPAILISLSILFIFLALSMFGVFNLALPSSWQNRLNNLSNGQKSGSYWGVLSMGAISGLVASPCTTAPLTGALLYISQTGDLILGASALYALSIGMGIPLLVLGSSGGKLLPKAGAWMNVIKNVFGLLLLAVPIFLLERFIDEVYIDALWALLIISTGIYFLIVNKGTQKTFSFGVRTAVIYAVLFIGYQKAYQIVFPQNIHTAQKIDEHKQFTIVKSLTELKVAVQKANNNNQSVMVDLYADWCIACKEFEEYTFPTPQVQKALNSSLLIQIDLTDTSSPESIELMENYDIFGLPSILFFDTNGKELTNNRVTGFMGADEFAAHINNIL